MTTLGKQGQSYRPVRISFDLRPDYTTLCSSIRDCRIAEFVMKAQSLCIIIELSCKVFHAFLLFSERLLFLLCNRVGRIVGHGQRRCARSWLQRRQLQELLHTQLRLRLQAVT